jgi:hypothetical protein
MERKLSTNTLNPSTPIKPSTHTKFRYVVHGIPKNKLYTIEEARWCDDTKQFVSEKIHTIQSLTLKQWIGYIPSTVGDIKTVMWMGFPALMWEPNSLLSPLGEWENKKDLFSPYSLERFRFFPQGSCQEQAMQIEK